MRRLMIYCPDLSRIWLADDLNNKSCSEGHIISASYLVEMKTPLRTVEGAIKSCRLCFILAKHLGNNTIQTICYKYIIEKMCDLTMITNLTTVFPNVRRGLVNVDKNRAPVQRKWRSVLCECYISN